MKIYLKRICYFSAFWILGICECNAQIGVEPHITVSELKQVLMSEDDSAIIEAMNRVKQNQDSFDLMSFVTKLWMNSRSEFPDLPWNEIDSDGIRIEIANVLTQASNNGLVNVKREDLRAYAISVLNSENQDARGAAVSTLGLFRNSDDLNVMERIALEENPRTFGYAILALSRSCDAKATAIISSITKRVKRVDSKKFLQDSSTSLADYKFGCESR